MFCPHFSLAVDSAPFGAGCMHPPSMLIGMLDSIAGGCRCQKLLLKLYSGPPPLGNCSGFHSRNCLTDRRLDLHLDAGRCLCGRKRLLHSPPHAGLRVAGANREGVTSGQQHSGQATAGYPEVQGKPTCITARESW
jgi:hypothetical protein